MVWNQSRLTLSRPFGNSTGILIAIFFQLQKLDLNETNLNDHIGYKSARELFDETEKKQTLRTFNSRVLLFFGVLHYLPID